MTSHMTSPFRPRSLRVALLAALLLIIGATQASADPGQARFTIACDSYTWAHGLAAQIDGSALLTRTGDGHTSVFTSDCAKSAMDGFLVEHGSEANRICQG